MTINYFKENWLTKPNIYVQEPLSNGNLKLTEILPYNPNDDTMTRTLYNGGIVKGRRSDYLNIKNIYFYHYKCHSCGDICLTTRNPGKWPKRGMTCGSKDSSCFIPNRNKSLDLGRVKTGLSQRVYRGKIYTIEDVPAYMYKLRPNCKDILRAWIKKMSNGVKYHYANREKISIYSKKHYKENAKRINEQTMEYYWANKEHLNQKQREYNERYVEKNIAYRKWYRETHKEEAREYRKEYHKRHPERKMISQIIHDSFKYAGIHKWDTTANMGFDREGIKLCLREHAKSLGFKGIRDIKSTGLYHVDHIIPKSRYNLKNHKEMLKCNSPLNLRWLPAKENISKGNRIRPEDVELIKQIKHIWPKGFKLEDHMV